MPVGTAYRDDLVKYYQEVELAWSLQTLGYEPNEV